MSEPKANGELYTGMELLTKAYEQLEADWASGTVRLPNDMIQKKLEQAEKAEQQARECQKILKQFSEIALKE